MKSISLVVSCFNVSVVVFGWIATLHFMALYVLVASWVNVSLVKFGLSTVAILTFGFSSSASFSIVWVFVFGWAATLARISWSGWVARLDRCSLFVYQFIIVFTVHAFFIFRCFKFEI